MHRDLLQSLNGVWRFERTATGLAAMTGRAVFTAAGADESVYDETGTTLMAEGGSFQFSRRYLYRASDASLDILFDETPPRLYQSIRLAADGNALVGSAQHRCQPDEYRSSYRFALPAQFSTVHAVTGPRKNYAIETTYLRASS